MQIVPSTFNLYAPQIKELTGMPPDVNNPFHNLLAGALLYKNYLTKTGGNVAAAASLYHAGSLSGIGPISRQYGQDIERKYMAAAR
jgi:soluble lytic murein transglycosylase-like protein